MNGEISEISLRVTVRRSKTDQKGRGIEKAIPHGRFIHPVALVREWLDAAGITEGLLFRPISRSGNVRGLRHGAAISGADLLNVGSVAEKAKLNLEGVWII